MLDGLHPTYDPNKAEADARILDPKKPKNPKPRRVAESPRRGQTVRVSVDDPMMNLSVGNRNYRTRDGVAEIPIADAQRLAESGIPGLKIYGAWTAGIGPGERFNGRWRHESDLACNCKREDCKWPWPEYDDEDENTEGE